MRHLDLFSGIGGFALATEMVWDNVEHTFCDNDLFSQTILKKHWPQSKIYGDIRTLTANTNSARQSQQEGTEQDEWGWTPNSVDVLTGGFPCQPFSSAGRRKGTEDDRHLWPQMLRVISEFHPRWVIGENVGGLVTWSNGMVLEQVQTDLESQGYSVQAFIIPAVALNAPHRRDRVWIVAYAEDTDDRRDTRKLPQENEQQASERQEKWNAELGSTDTRNASNPGRKHGQPRDRKESRQNTTKRSTQAGKAERFGAYDTDSERTGRTRSSAKDERRPRPLNRYGSDKGGSWDQNWFEVATRLCTMDDGLPNGLARPRGWRHAALKGAGNAIVPQVAAEIMKVIKQIDDGRD